MQVMKKNQVLMATKPSQKKHQSILKDKVTIKDANTFSFTLIDYTLMVF